VTKFPRETSENNKEKLVLILPEELQPSAIVKQ